MRVTQVSVRSVPVNHRGNWLFVLIRTEDGRCGLGEASHGGAGGDDRVRALIEGECRRQLVGRLAEPVLPLVARLTPLAGDRAGATAVSGCEQALWDLAGQALGIPLHRLLGGPFRRRIPLYANINRATIDRTPAGFAANAAAAAGEGFRAIKCAPFDGLPSALLATRAGQALVDAGLACVAAVRAAIGPEVALLVDCHSRFDLATAVRVAHALADLGVTWFEEPVPTEDLPGLGAVRLALRDERLPQVELIGGEAIFGLEGFWPYLQAGVWDVVMPDVKHCGGVMETWAIGQTALAAGAAVAPHNPSGPVATAVSAQISAAWPALRALEYAWGEVPWRAELIEPAERVENGELILSDEPGIGARLQTAVLGGLS